MKKIFVFFLIFSAVVLSLIYVWIKRVASDVFVESPIIKSLSIKPQTPTSIKEYVATKTPFTIVVVGYAGGKHDGAYLTDTIIAVHIDPKTKKIFTISIPRDIWIKNSSDSKYGKINAAYVNGIAKEVVGKVIGIPVPYHIALNFSGFTKTIDTLGGVEIVVNPAFTDTQYPIEGKETEVCDHSPEEIPQLDKLAATTSAELVFPCRYETLVFSKGLQHMDGDTALKYVRSRHSQQDGSDFARAKRQQNLALAVKQKIFTIGFLPKFIPFMTSLRNDVRTDLTPDDVKTFIEQANELNTFTIVPLALSDKNYLRDAISNNGQNILESIDGPDNWSTVHTWLANTFAGLPTPQIARILVQNGTRTPGLAQVAIDDLIKLNMQVGPPGNAPDRDVLSTTVTIYDPTIRNEDKTKLQSLFGIQHITASNEATPSGYNVRIILGSDYVSKITPP